MPCWLKKSLLSEILYICFKNELYAKEPTVRLLAAVCDTSFLRFSYLVSYESPFLTRAKQHICLHQKNI